MRIGHTFVLLLAGVFACQSGTHPPPDNTVDADRDRTMIGDLLAQSETIFVAGDLNFAMALLDDDFVALWPGMEPVTGREAIKAHYRDNVFGRWNYIAHTHDTRQLEVAGPWAFWWGYGEGVVEPKFKTPARPSKLDPYADRLSAWLLAQTRKSRKDRRTLKQMHADLVKLGYDGSYGRVAAFARAWRADRHQADFSRALGPKNQVSGNRAARGIRICTAVRSTWTRKLDRSASLLGYGHSAGARPRR